MVSIENRILKALSEQGRGSIVFPADFSNYGEHKAVGKAMERLTTNGQIIRLARGIYYYPKIDTMLGLGILFPSVEEIAENIARRDKARVVPTGMHALNKLGLSTQVPMNVVYLTDGTPRKINLGKGRTIQFKSTRPGNLAFSNELAMLVTFALKELTKEGITDDQLKVIRKQLSKESKEKVMADLALMPAWIRSIIINAYE